jgi:hypothetical protein
MNMAPRMKKKVQKKNVMDARDAVELSSKRPTKRFLAVPQASYLD